MFFYVSLVLVIVAAVTLVIGLLSSGLPLVIVSIVASFLAGVFLIFTVMRDRPRPAAAPEAPPEPVVPGAVTTRPSVVEEEALGFPIADYDDLRVSEIVPLLPELDDDELEDVRDREASGKARATILTRIDELLEVEEEPEEEWAEEALGFPIADYDDLRVSEIVPLLPELDDDELEDVRDREASGKARATILTRIDELLGTEAPAPAPAPTPRAKAAAGGGSRQSRAKQSATRSAGGAKGAKKAAFPIANYDDLTVSDVAKRLKRLDSDELKQVRTYEKRTKSRKGVLDRIEAELTGK